MYSSSKSASPNEIVNNITDSKLNVPISEKDLSTFYLNNEKKKRKLVKLNKVPLLNIQSQNDVRFTASISI